ncbi:MAG: uroporphyrinogen decarboxylase family protein [Candidatus Firestonebacteria bacterium]
MPQTPREIVIRNMSLTSPSRIGMAFSPTGAGESRMNDFSGKRLKAKGWEQKKWEDEKFEYYDDVWGNVWYRIKGFSAGGEILTPAIKKWEDLKSYKAPDFENAPNLTEIKKAWELDNNQHFRMLGIPGFIFSNSRYLRKMEIYFEDLALERENIHKLHSMVADVLETIINKAAEIGADGIVFCEDWGTQDRTLISPDMFKKLFKPYYKRLMKAARQKNLLVEMHSCGYNWALLPDIIDTGVNCFQFDQPTIYGMEKLGAYLQKRKVCLFSPVDIQKVLPTGDKKLIEQTARDLVKYFYGKNGGFMAKNYGDLHGIGVTEESDKWAYEAFLEFCR